MSKIIIEMIFFNENNIFLPLLSKKLFLYSLYIRKNIRKNLTCT